MPRKGLPDIIRISLGSGNNLGKSKNKNITWEQFQDLFRNPTRTRERHADYLKLPQDRKLTLKSTDGWFLGGPVSQGKRTKATVQDRNVLTIDIDDLDALSFAELRSKRHRINKFTYVAHTTRGSTQDTPKIRINLPLSRAASREEYEPLARIFSQAHVDSTLDAVDDVTYRVAQMMFLPTLSSDQPYDFWTNVGQLVDPGKILSAWPGDWRDFSALPYSAKRRKARRTADKAQNPLEKNGVVGAFCRAYTVEEAIEAFLPDVYAPADVEIGGKPRYTYLQGSGANGVVVEDGGLFIYSHHSSDPCGEQLVNAFDMVRLHLHGQADDAKDLDGLPITEYPSYKAMASYAQECEPVRQELLADMIDVDAILDDVADLEQERLDALRGSQRRRTCT